MTRSTLPLQGLRRSDLAPAVAARGGTAADVDAAAAGAYAVTTVADAAQLLGLADEWNALFARAAWRFPFQHHEWAVAWWTHLRRRSGWCRDALRVFVVRDVAGSAVAIAPFMLTRYGAPGLSVCRVLQPMGADPNITELRGMLVLPGHERPAIDALRAHIGRLRGIDVIRWGAVPTEAGGAELLVGDRTSRPEPSISGFVLPLSGTWEEFRASRPRNVRESLRKCYNSLARDGHRWTFHALEDVGEIVAGLDEFFALHAMRASAPQAVPHPDYFADPRARAFLRQIVERFGARSAARLYRLEVNGRVVAARLGFLLGDCLYLYYSGYDPEWGRYSVMTTVVAETLRCAIAGGVPLVNLSTGADVSKLRWRPQELGFEAATVVAPGVRARVAERVLHRALRLRTRPTGGETASTVGSGSDATGGG